MVVSADLSIHAVSKYCELGAVLLGVVAWQEAVSCDPTVATDAPDPWLFAARCGPDMIFFISSLYGLQMAVLACLRAVGFVLPCFSLWVMVIESGRLLE